MTDEQIIETLIAKLKKCHDRVYKSQYRSDFTITQYFVIDCYHKLTLRFARRSDELLCFIKDDETSVTPVLNGRNIDQKIDDAINLINEITSHYNISKSEKHIENLTEQATQMVSQYNHEVPTPIFDKDFGRPEDYQILISESRMVRGHMNIDVAYMLIDNSKDFEIRVQAKPQGSISTELKRILDPEKLDCEKRIAHAYTTPYNLAEIVQDMISKQCAKNDPELPETHVKSDRE